MKSTLLLCLSAFGLLTLSPTLPGEPVTEKRSLLTEDEILSPATIRSEGSDLVTNCEPNLFPQIDSEPIGHAASVQGLPGFFTLTEATSPVFIDLRDPLEVRFVITNSGGSAGTIPFVDLRLSGTGREIDATLTDITIAPGDAFEGLFVYDTVDEIFEVGSILAWTVVIRDTDEFMGGRTEVANTIGPGSLKWFFETNSGIQSSAAIGPDGTVCIGSRDGRLYALDGVSGEERWAFPTGWMVNSTPAIRTDGTVYVGSSDRHVYAIAGATGEELWAFETGGQVESSPAIGMTGAVYVGSADGYVYAIDGTTGEELWTFATGDNVRSSPAIGRNGILYVGSADRNVYALNSATGEEIWTFNTSGLVYSSPAIGSDGTVYIGSGDRHLYALDGQTGEELWSVRTGGAVYSSPVLGSGERLFVGSNDRRIYAIDTSNGETIWSYETGGVIDQASAAVGADNTVYIGSSDRHLYALDGDTGEPIWSFETAARIESAPAIGDDGTIYFGSWNHRVYALNGEGPLFAGPWPKFRYSPRNNGSIQTAFPPDSSSPEERIASFFDLEQPDRMTAGRQVESRWLGTLALNNTFDIDAVEGWLFHDQHGWLYWSGTGWFWRHSQQRWTYMTGETYPFVYVHQVGWFYFYPDSPLFPRRQWFSSYREENGAQVPDVWVRLFHHARNDVTAFRLDPNAFEPGLELILLEDADQETGPGLRYTIEFGEDGEITVPLSDEAGSYRYEIIDSRRAQITLLLAPVGDPGAILEDELLLTFDSANEGRYEKNNQDPETETPRQGVFLFR